MFYSIGWYVRKSDLKKMVKAFDFVFTFEKNDFINKVIEGDAIEVMREIPDNSVDMTFADPPFNLGKKYNNYKDKKKVDEYQVPYLFTIFPNDLFILHLGKMLLPTHCGIVLQDYGGKKNKMHSYGPLISYVWKDIHRIRHKKRRDKHPCQLPIPLMVAKRLGRNYITIDIDSKYMKITKEKLENVQPTKINNTYVSIYLGKI